MKCDAANKPIVSKAQIHESKQKSKACVRKLFLLPRGCGGFFRLSRGNPVPFITPSESTAFTVATHTNNVKQCSKKESGVLY